MIITSCNISRMLTGASSQLQLQSKRFKGPRRLNRENWKPIPPKVHRYHYYKEKKPFDWTAPFQTLKATEKETPSAITAPEMMHVVTRCKPLKGQMAAYKALCDHFDIGRRMHKPVLVANTPSNNELLLQIKHLIRVKPLTAVHGLPSDASELTHTQLRTDGSLSVIKSVRLPTDSSEPVRLLQTGTVKEKNQKKIANREILSEYFKTTYRWKYNEDGKESPYKHIVGN